MARHEPLSFSNGQPRCSWFSQQELQSVPVGANLHVSQLFVWALFTHAMRPSTLPAVLLHTCAHVAPCSSPVVTAV